MHINESVSVETLASGAPIRFVWRGVTYGVVSSPEPWISRRSWWSEGGIRDVASRRTSTHRWRAPHGRHVRFSSTCRNVATFANGTNRKHWVGSCDSSE
jgi:hypothetical protein